MLTSMLSRAAHTVGPGDLRTLVWKTLPYRAEQVLWLPDLFLPTSMTIHRVFIEFL